MTRSTIKDWKVESIFRDLSLKGIRIDENLWLKNKYGDFQEMEDPSLRSMALFPEMVQSEKNFKMCGDFEYVPDPTQEGPSCSMLEQVVRRSSRDTEEKENE